MSPRTCLAKTASRLLALFQPWIHLMPNPTTHERTGRRDVASVRCPRCQERVRGPAAAARRRRLQRQPHHLQRIMSNPVVGRPFPFPPPSIGRRRPRAGLHHLPYGGARGGRIGGGGGRFWACLFVFVFVFGVVGNWEEGPSTCLDPPLRIRTTCASIESHPTLTQLQTQQYHT